MSNNRKKDVLLGEPHGTAAARLRKMLLFKYVQMVSHDDCCRCGEKIERIEELSIEHVRPWQSAENPKVAFFDLENIAFSHVDCNVPHERSNGNIAKTHCPRGHAYTPDNTYKSLDGKRRCKECRRTVYGR